jgi:hypothetical protein
MHLPLLVGLAVGAVVILLGSAVLFLLNRAFPRQREPVAASVSPLAAPRPPVAELPPPAPPPVVLPPVKPLQPPPAVDPVPPPPPEPVAPPPVPPAADAPPPKPADAAPPPAPAPPQLPDHVWDRVPVAQQTRINKAIDKGVAYLKGAFTVDKVLGDPTPENFYQLNIKFGQNGLLNGKIEPFEIPGNHPGMPPLIGLTLLECGMPPADPKVQKAAALARTSAATLTNCYCLSLTILFLDRLGDPQDEDLIRQCGLQMAAGQGSGGGWSYNAPRPTREQQADLLALFQHPDAKPPANLAQLPVAQFRPGQKLQDAPDANTVVQVQPGAMMQFTTFSLPADNSNTQFATLAMWVARRHNLPLERTLAMVDARFRQSVSADGGWDYASWGRGAARATSTCAGLLALAAGRGSSPAAKGNLARDPAVEKALRFLGKTVVGKKPGNPAGGALAGGRLIGADAWGDIYCLWSIERVAVIYDLADIDGKDWYNWGAEVLVANQRDDGSWRDTYTGPDTCFALLFLKRANVAKDLTAMLKGMNATASGPTESYKDK